MRPAPRDVRDHIVSQKNDHGPSYWRYGTLQRYSHPKINFREIFGVVRFSTFATKSATSRHGSHLIRPRRNASKGNCLSNARQFYRPFDRLNRGFVRPEADDV